MPATDCNHKMIIDQQKTVLDIISHYRQTEAIFKQYDQEASACICCEALFDSLESLARNYNLNLEQLVDDLNAVIKI